MAEMTLNELRRYVRSVITEAKKKAKKADDLKKDGGKAASAYGFYDESLDFSEPLGAFNRYALQGGVNWGPGTSSGAKVDQNFRNPEARGRLGEAERVLRSVIREVLEEAGDSAWAPVLAKAEPIFESSWEQAIFEAKRWYEKKEEADAAGPQGKGFEATQYGDVKKHGADKKK